MKPTRVRSREAFERARHLIPGGVNSPDRAFGAAGGEPTFIARGVPAGGSQDTLLLRYNDTQALADAFAAHGERIAGVILESVVVNMGLVPPAPEFLDQLRQLTQRHGALLIYDEVMTGFRLA